MVLVLFVVVVAAGQNDYTARLKALGYRPSEISEIKPSVARVVARRGLPRPQSGMPESWRVPQPPPPPKKQQSRARFRNVRKFVTSLLVRVALPTGLVFAFGGSLWPGIVLLAAHLHGATRSLTHSVHHALAHQRSSPKRPVVRKPQRRPPENLDQDPEPIHLDDDLRGDRLPREPPNYAEDVVLDGPDDRSIRRNRRRRQDDIPSFRQPSW